MVTIKEEQNWDLSRNSIATLLLDICVYWKTTILKFIITMLRTGWKTGCKLLIVDDFYHPHTALPQCHATLCFTKHKCNMEKLSLLMVHLLAFHKSFPYQEMESVHAQFSCRWLLEKAVWQTTQLKVHLLALLRAFNHITQSRQHMLSKTFFSSEWRVPLFD